MLIRWSVLEPLAKWWLLGMGFVPVRTKGNRR